MTLFQFILLLLVFPAKIHQHKTKIKKHVRQACAHCIHIFVSLINKERSERKIKHKKKTTKRTHKKLKM